MEREISAVLEYGAPAPSETAAMMEDKLRFHTDSWDLSVDLRAGLSDIVAIDARSRDACAAGHIPGAVSFPHREMSAETTAQLGPQQDLCRLLRRDRLQCINQGRVQARSARISRQGTARRDRLVAPRRAPGDHFARARQFTGGRIAASRSASSPGPRRLETLLPMGCSETRLLISALQAKAAVDHPVKSREKSLPENRKGGPKH
jgi:hypothetical protein